MDSSANSGPVAARPLSQIRIVGGRVCLDFVNTIHDRFAATREDYISDAGRYFAWSTRVRILSNAEYARMALTAGDKHLMSDVRKFREELYAFLLEYISGRVPSPPASLTRWMAEGWGGLRFDCRAQNYMSWQSRAVDVYLPLKRIALDVLEMLQQGQRTRIRMCAARGECGWLFYDVSKGGTRRWCSMETCGSIAKMRRYRG
jgi:predicted RNA-binding Zn ribbon-like protein